ncbi:MAG: (2Fe-2S) ferredoxin domain-containing protein [Phormidesmis sp.]
MMSAQSKRTKSDSPEPDSPKLDSPKLDSPKLDSPKLDKAKVIVCQNKTCKQQGSAQVLAAFKRSVPVDVLVEPSGCLGQCGNGPMAVVITEAGQPEAGQPETELPEARRTEAKQPEAEQAEPDKTWYSAVRPADAFAIAAHHFKKDDEAHAQAALPQSSSQPSTVWIWLVGLFLFLSLCALMALVLGGPARYG